MSVRVAGPDTERVATAPRLVLGRDRDLAELYALVDGIDDRGGALVVRGEAGIGKSTLLAAARERALDRGVTVVSTAGALSEAQLAFAGLHQLLFPLLGRLGLLPDPQRQALETAFRIADGDAPDLFLIGLATLGLVAERSSETPLLFVVDDAQWLDRPSSEVLAFVARRIESDPAVLLFGIREGLPSSFDDAAMPELPLSGLDQDASNALLDLGAAALPVDLRRRILAGPIPRHVAVIMDGNGRWATGRGLPRVAGHGEGVKAVRNIVRTAGELGVQFLTLYAFSSENWQRPHQEVSTLMTLLERSIERELPELMERNVRFRAIGRPEGVPPRVAAGIRRLTDITAGNTGLTLLMAFNYGGRDELVDAVRSLARDVARGALRPEDIDEVRLARALYTDGVPDPDLLIRTSGELRISNFLLWQIAYTELWVTPTLWPDFGARDFCLALADFQQRDRRFGRV